MSKKTENSSVEKTADELKQEVQNLTATVAELTNSNETLVSENETLSAENVKLTTDNEQLKENNAELVSKHETLVSENETLKLAVKEDAPQVLEETEEAYKANRPTITLDDGREFAFKFGTPKTLRVDENSKKLEDLIKDKDTMEDLIYGNSFFVEQVN